MKRMIFALVLVLAAASANQAGEREKIVKGSVKASNIDAEGKQTVTVTLEIKKGFYIFANPIDLKFKDKSEPDFELDQVNVSVKAKEPLKVKVFYPAANTRSDGPISYKYYEGIVAVEASLQRAAGDQSPLEITIHCRPMARTVCMPPERIKLTAK